MIVAKKSQKMGGLKVKNRLDNAYNLYSILKTFINYFYLLKF
jgi:hypothetical protein